MNIHQKVFEVMKEVSQVEKKGFNEYHKYNYMQESDIIAALRPSLVKHGILLLSSIDESTRVDELTTITMTMTLVNVDNPKETLVSKWKAEGSDKGDKGLNKAITAAKKFFLINTFLLEANNDAEADTAVDKRVDNKTTKPKETVNNTSKTETKKSGFRVPTNNKPPVKTQETPIAKAEPTPTATPTTPPPPKPNGKAVTQPEDDWV